MKILEMGESISRNFAPRSQLTRQWDVSLLFNPLMADESLTLQEICDLASVSSRTVRYYIQQGLLPPADRAGPGATYGQGHLDRLHLILKLKSQHLPLSEISRRLTGLSDADILSLLKGAAPVHATSAADYVAAVLSGTSAPVRGPTQHKASPPKAARSSWERHTICPEVEVHIKRPLSREDDRRVKALLRHAHDLFTKDNS